MSNEEAVRQAWNTLRRAGEIPLPTHGRYYYNPNHFIGVSRQEDVVRVQISNGVQDRLVFDTEEEAQAFVDAMTMHWVLSR